MNKRGWMPWVICCCLSLFFLSLPGEEETKIRSTHYKYQAGDDIQWALPDFDDSQWPTAKTGTTPGEEWNGSGWLRFHLDIPANLLDKPLALRLGFLGAAEIYLEGKKVVTLGSPAASKEEEKPYITQKKDYFPVFVSGQTSRHVLAVRFSNFVTHSSPWNKNALFFIPLLEELEPAIEEYTRRLKRKTFHQMLLTGVFLALGILHLLLYCFLPKQPPHLYFGLFTTASAFAVFLQYQIEFIHSPGSQLVYMQFFLISLVCLALMGIRFMYSLLYSRPPRIYLVLLAIAVPIFILVFFDVFLAGRYAKYFSLLTVPEIIRASLSHRTHDHGKPLSKDSWIVGLGVLPLTLVGLYQILIEFGIVREILLRGVPRPFYAMLFLMIAMSVYLARQFAATNKALEAKLLEVEDLSRQTLESERKRIKLEAENERKNKELEEARQLQLSMLPKQVPALPYLEIAVHMETATEVGGDYYDFHTHEDGSLTSVIGDATGHGMQAGTMVTATKSLFNAFAAEPEPVEFLRKTSKGLKKLGFRKMFMALTMLRFDKHRLKLAAAGMPFALIYHEAGGGVDEVVLKGVPLGSLVKYTYKQAEYSLEKGDTILLMSDGLPEAFSPRGDLFGMQRVNDLFRANAAKSPGEIIDVLVEAGKKWTGGHKAHDDITLMVIKMK